MDEMRAARYDRYGPPEVLYEGRAPVPEPGPGEVLVRVHAASVNGGDLHVRSGRLAPFSGYRFPKRTGVDFAGEVAAVPSGVRGPREGARVWGTLGRRLGSAAEYVTVRPRQLAYAPANLSPEEAVSLLAGGTTGITALRDKAGLRAGERLLVRGGSGGVGSVVVQLGKLFGAHVTAIASANSRDFVRGLGADAFLDRRTTRAGDLDPFDVVLDTVGTEHAAYRRLLGPGGRMVSLAFDTAHKARGVGYLLASTVHGPRRVRFFSGNPTHDLFAELARYAEQGAVRPVVDTVHPLSGIARAHRALEAGGVRGKHVLRVTP